MYGPLRGLPWPIEVDFSSVFPTLMRPSGHGHAVMPFAVRVKLLFESRKDRGNLFRMWPRGKILSGCIVGIVRWPYPRTWPVFDHGLMLWRSTR